MVAMWALFATAALASCRRRRHPGRWRRAHGSLALVIVGCTAIHALLIEGTDEPISKVALSTLAVVATLLALRRVYPVPPEAPCAGADVKMGEDLYQLRMSARRIGRLYGTSTSSLCVLDLCCMRGDLRKERRSADVRRAPHERLLIE